MNYWNKKEELKQHAITWTKQMEEFPTSKGVVFEEVNGTLYNDYDEWISKSQKVKFVDTTISTGDVDYAINMAYQPYQFCPTIMPYDRIMYVLNFASFKNPGGKFLEGSSAQEESLCHRSNLYNHLREEKEYYECNKEDLNGGLYKNRCIIHHNVAYQDNIGMFIPINVITCAAPNATAARRRGMSEETINDALYNRIEFLRNVLSNYKIDILILGAWGCGVFGNDASIVAKYFRTLFIDMPVYDNNRICHIIHPIPDDKNRAKFLNEYKSMINVDFLKEVKL